MWTDRTHNTKKKPDHSGYVKSTALDARLRSAIARTRPIHVSAWHPPEAGSAAADRYAACRVKLDAKSIPQESLYFYTRDERSKPKLQHYKPFPSGGSTAGKFVYVQQTPIRGPGSYRPGTGINIGALREGDRFYVFLGTTALPLTLYLSRPSPRSPDSTPRYTAKQFYWVKGRFPVTNRGKTVWVVGWILSCHLDRSPW
jgi:hypothetical protein